MLEYIFKTKGLLHVIKFQSATNKKLGQARRIISTYHFDQRQIDQLDLTLDAKNCGDCIFSHTNNGAVSGGCYTHKGLQRFGLLSMMKRLNRIQGSVEDFDRKQFNEFVATMSGSRVELLRFGAYGEAVLMPKYAFQTLVDVFPNHVGYTHMWQKKRYQYASKHIMASTHNAFEAAIANDMGWRVFNIGKLDGAVNCPASAEMGKRTTCTECKLCNGTNGNSKKQIFINSH